MHLEYEFEIDKDWWYFDEKHIEFKSKYSMGFEKFYYGGGYLNFDPNFEDYSVIKIEDVLFAFYYYPQKKKVCAIRLIGLPMGDINFHSDGDKQFKEASVYAAIHNIPIVVLKPFFNIDKMGEYKFKSMKVWG